MVTAKREHYLLFRASIEDKIEVSTQTSKPLNVFLIRIYLTWCQTRMQSVMMYFNTTLIAQSSIMKTDSGKVSKVNSICRINTDDRILEELEDIYAIENMSFLSDSLEVIKM
jgi:hypothetical protein